MTRALIPVLLLAVATPVLAQQGGPVVGSVAPRYKDLSTWIVQTAEQVPESLYSFKPNPAVRTLGQLIGHVANAHYLFCATALAEPAPKHPDYEQVADKVALVTAIRESAAYCERAYQISDAVALEQATLFGSATTRLGVLVWNATHDGEHYGNLVVYMRSNGITPPSSQGGN
jgi:uncharacterized damage-inducible protein DinB